MSTFRPNNDLLGREVLVFNDDDRLIHHGKLEKISSPFGYTVNGRNFEVGATDCFDEVLGKLYLTRACEV